ncbi:MAG: MBL fold metallo-hydrolase [Patescibacteria group bacterium]
MGKYVRFRLGLVLVLFIFLFSTNALLWSRLLFSADKYLTVAFLDIGQGDSILIESPTGNRILVDAGPGKAVLSELAEVLPWNDRKLDILLGTHPDQDHVGGFVHILPVYRTRYFLEPGVQKSTKIWDSLKLRVEEYGLKDIIVRRGYLIDLGGGVQLETLYPDRDVRAVKDTNDGSIVAKLSYKDRTFLLTGDATLLVESRLLSYASSELKSDVLKVGHHGSRTSSGDKFISAVSPDYAVISVGEKNSYGHPHPDVLSRLQKFVPGIFRTDKEGRILIKVSKEGEIIVETKNPPLD